MESTSLGTPEVVKGRKVTWGIKKKNPLNKKNEFFLSIMKAIS